MITRATYNRCGLDGCDEPVELTAECFQDSGDGFGSEVLIVWTDDCLATLAALDFDAEELVGATECIEEAFWAAEAEACRVSKVRQQTGEVAA